MQIGWCDVAYKGHAESGEVLAMGRTVGHTMVGVAVRGMMDMLVGSSVGERRYSGYWR